MGANEIKATVGSNGEIRFDNLAHIDSLDPTDLLSIRLYLNHDAANTLWEWAFTRNGLHVYCEVPGNTQKQAFLANYELLAKGLGAYNQGSARFSGGAGNSWINVLLSRPTPTSKEFTSAAAIKYENRTDAEKILFSLTEAVRYAMWIMHDSDKLALPHRTYVWKGGEGVDVNGDGEIKNIPADPNANPPKPEVIEETVEWCFAYGEADWMGGKTWNQVKRNAENIAYGLPVAQGTSDPRVQCH